VLPPRRGEAGVLLRRMSAPQRMNFSATSRFKPALPRAGRPPPMAAAPQFAPGFRSRPLPARARPPPRPASRPGTVGQGGAHLGGRGRRGRAGGPGQFVRAGEAGRSPRAGAARRAAAGTPRPAATNSRHNSGTRSGLGVGEVVVQARTRPGLQGGLEAVAGQVSAGAARPDSGGRTGAGPACAGAPVAPGARAAAGK